MTSPHPTRLPDPMAIGDWSELTAVLRDLHLVCGRPTYEALSGRCGLPKSAISYLIGRNPVRRPSEAAVLRFVRGCLSYRAYAPEQIGDELERWRTAWARLEQSPESKLRSEPDPGPDPTESAAVRPLVDRPESSRGRPRRRALLVVAGLAVVAAGGWAGGHQATRTATPAPALAPRVTESPAASPSLIPATSAPANPSPTAAAGIHCSTERTHYVDARLDRSWSSFAYCSNKPTPVYAWPQRDAHPVGRLETRTSWFACWTHGRTDAAEIWFYTQGDTTQSRPEFDSWGFVPGSVLGVATTPPADLARCDFVGR